MDAFAGLFVLDVLEPVQDLILLGLGEEAVRHGEEDAVFPMADRFLPKPNRTRSWTGSSMSNMKKPAKASTRSTWPWPRSWKKKLT